MSKIRKNFENKFLCTTYSFSLNFLEFVISSASSFHRFRRHFVYLG